MRQGIGFLICRDTKLNRVSRRLHKEVDTNEGYQEGYRKSVRLCPNSRDLAGYRNSGCNSYDQEDIDFDPCTNFDVGLGNISFIFPQRVANRVRKDNPLRTRHDQHVNFSIMAAVISADGTPQLNEDGTAKFVMVPVNGGRIKQLIVGHNPDGTTQLSDNGPFVSLDGFQVKDQAGATRWINIVNLTPEQKAYLVRLYLAEVSKKAAPQAVMA